MASEGHAREANCRHTGLLQRATRGGGKGCCPNQVVRKTSRGRPYAPTVCADAILTGCDTAEWETLLLEKRVPSPHRFRLVPKGDEARHKNPIAPLAVILFQLDGALNQVKEEASAVGNRDAHYVLNIAGSWEQAGDDRVNIEWAREAWTDMRSFSTGGTYINFLTEDEGPERIKAALARDCSDSPK